MGQPGAKIEPFLRCFYPVPCPSFTSFSLWFFFWKGCPDLSGFDQTKFGLSFLPHAIQTLWSRWMLAHLRYTSLSRYFEQIQWRRKGGLHYEEAEIQDNPHPCRKQHRNPEPQSSAEHSVAGKSGHRLRRWSFAQSHVRPCQENLKTTYCTDWIKPFISLCSRARRKQRRSIFFGWKDLCKGMASFKEPLI